MQYSEANSVKRAFELVLAAQATGEGLREMLRLLQKRPEPGFDIKTS